MIPKEYFQSIEIINFIKNRLGYFNVNKCLFVPPWMPWAESFEPNVIHSNESIADALYYYLTHDAKINDIVFASHPEAFSKYFIINMQIIIGILHKKYNIPLDKITYLSGAHHAIENIELYNKLCEDNNFYKVKLILANPYETSPKIKYDLKRDLTPRIMSKLFTSMNGQPRLFRVVVLSELIRRGLLEQGFFSMYNLTGIEDENWIKSLTLNGSTQFPNAHLSLETNLNKIKDKLPLTLSRKNNSDSNFFLEDIHYLNNSYISLVCETVFTKDGNLPDDIFYDCFDFSEKTFRTIYYKHPFLLLAKANSLAVLRNAGYKTFHPFIDESYDSIENDEERLFTVMGVLEKMSEFTHEKWIKFQTDVKPIVEHNNRLLSFRINNKRILSLTNY